MLSSPAKRKDPQRRFQLHQSVPIVNTKFQEALDRFEDEIVSVLQRGYEEALTVSSSDPKLL